MVTNFCPFFCLFSGKIWAKIFFRLFSVNILCLHCKHFMFTVTDPKISENIKIKNNFIKSQKKYIVSNISTPSKNINKMHTCKICDYTTSRKYNLNKHMLSKKHKKRAEPPKKVAKNSGEKSNICKNIICDDNPSQKNSEENVECFTPLETPCSTFFERRSTM